MGIRRVWWEARRRWRALLGACALLAALGARLPAHHAAREHFPRAQPHALAQLLADFAHQPDVGAWSVVADRTNYTTWSYAVTYECGARCAGRALVEAHDEPAGGARPAHGAAARRHRVVVLLTACSHLPLLPWPSFCDETETVMRVQRGSPAEGGGAALEVAARARCPLWRGAWDARGACGARLRAHVAAHLLRVRAALGTARAH